MNNTNLPEEPESWVCEGSPKHPHEPIENWGNVCNYPGCKMTRPSGVETGLINPGLWGTISKKPALIAGIFILALTGGALLLYLTGRCPSGQSKVNGQCTDKPTLSNIGGQGSIGNSSVNQPSSASGGQTPGTSSSISSTPDISSGEEVLLGRGGSNPDRDLGVEEFIAGNYGDAIKFFNKAVYNDPTDPEVQIFLNNAQARLKGNPIVLATVLPIDNKEGSAREMLRGVADAQTQFNKVGGVGNRLVEIIIANDANEAKQATSVAQKLATNQNIVGIIGHNSSGMTKSALPEYEKSGLAVISPTSTSTSISSPVFFRTIPSDAIAGKKLANYTYNAQWDKPVNNVAIFYNPNSPYSQSLHEAFSINFQQLGGTVYDSIDISARNFDPRRQINNIRDKVEAIALFPNTSTTTVATGIMKANTEVAGDKFLVVGGDALYTADTILKGDIASNNLVLAVPWFSGDQDYAKKAEERWKGTVNWRTATSFDATLALLSALLTSSNPTRQSVIQDLKSTNLPVDQTSGNPIKFTIQGEVDLEPLLVRITKGATRRPSGSDYGFELINE